MMAEVVEWVLEVVVEEVVEVVVEARMLPTLLISIGLICLTCLASSQIEAFLSGDGLLDGLFLTIWGGGITSLVRDRSLRFLDSGRRSSPPPR